MAVRGRPRTHWTRGRKYHRMAKRSIAHDLRGTITVQISTADNGGKYSRSLTVRDTTVEQLFGFIEKKLFGEG